MLAFAEQYHPRSAERVDDLLRFSKDVGGFELIRILKSEPVAVVALVKERSSDTYAEVEVRAEGEGDAAKVAALRVQQTRPPDDLAPKRLSAGELSAAVDQYVKERADLSGAVLVTRGDKTLVSKPFGMANREKSAPVNMDTRFRIGSMNKMFTAVAVLQLVDKGLVKLDAPLGTYLKDYPNANVASKVTIRHLLTHSGGTGDIFGPEFDKNRKDLRTLGDYVKLYGNRDLQFEPGSNWRYSNYGFLLLGVVVDAVSGKSYYDYVREHIFQPAGMTRTDSLSEEEMVADRSVGYMRREGKLVPNTETLPWRGTSAGGGYSTARDLERFARALLTGRLLKKETFAEAVKPHRNQYGFGFGAGNDGGRTFWGHGGGAPGMNGELRVYPDSSTVVVTLANLDPPAASRLADFIVARLPLN